MDVDGERKETSLDIGDRPCFDDNDTYMSNTSNDSNGSGDSLNSKYDHDDPNDSNHVKNDLIANSFDSIGDFGAHLDNLNIRNGLECCKELLCVLEQHFGEDCEPFMTEVDTSQYPDYAVIISNPMDLSKVKNKLHDRNYPSIFAFARDMRLIFHNAIFYNEDNSEINQTAKSLLIKFEQRFQKIVNRIHPNVKDNECHSLKQLEFAHIVTKLTQTDFNSVVDYINEQCPNALKESNESVENYELSVKDLDEKTLNRALELCHNAVNQEIHKYTSKNGANGKQKSRNKRNKYGKSRVTKKSNFY